MRVITKQAHPRGSVGTTASPWVDVSQWEKIAVEAISEAVGATPTLTLGLEISLEDNPQPGGTAFFIMLVSNNNDTPAAGIGPITTVGSLIAFGFLSQARFAKFARVSVSANTNVTFSSRLHGLTPGD